MSAVVKQQKKHFHKRTSIQSPTQKASIRQWGFWASFEGSGTHSGVEITRKR